MNKKLYCIELTESDLNLFIKIIDSYEPDDNYENSIKENILEQLTSY